MSQDLTLHTHPMSRGRIVRWALEEIGQPYRCEIVDYGHAMRSAAYLAVNPMGKVPALVHRGVVITECAAILCHLADIFPTAGLAPTIGDPARGAFYRWMFFGAGPVEHAATNKAFDLVFPDGKDGMIGFGTYAKVMDVLEAAIGDRAFLIGDALSMADIYVGMQLGWGMAFGTIEKRPAFARYVAALEKRPAAVRAKAIDDALVPAHPVPGMG